MHLEAGMQIAIVFTRSFSSFNGTGRDEECSKMCDDLTAHEEEAALAASGLNRRQFAAISAAGVLAACTGSESNAKARAGLTASTVAITTPDGTADAFWVRPAKGKHPAVIMWPDIAGLRPAYMEMGRQLASAGYAVLVVNHYYRSAKAPILASMAEWRTPEGQAKLKPMIGAITPQGVTTDTMAFVSWLDKQAAVDGRKGIGTIGYCMTGPYTVRAAAAVPRRIKAAASCHGGGLVTTAPDSPHRLIASTQASYLFAIARNDDTRAPDEKNVLKMATGEAERPAEIEVYNADHGWCTLDAPTYDRGEAQRAWGRVLALFGKL
jgi:carboxymethylenebutenolidase